MPLDIGPLSTEIELNGDVVELLQMPPGQVKWDVHPEAGQPGDSKQSKSAPLEFHRGFGASRRVRTSNGGGSDPAMHDYARNVIAMHEGQLFPAPRITYLDLHSLGTRTRAFRVGGYTHSRVGGNGSGVGAVGGGSHTDSPWKIIEHNGSLYALCGRWTFSIAPDLTTPAVVAGHDHGFAARARSGTIFGSMLGVALGAAVEEDWLTGAAIPATETTEDVTVTFSYTGGLQSLAIPAGVTSIVVDVQGAGPSGLGGRVRTTLTVTPLDTIYVAIGGVSGYNGGGTNAGDGSHGGGLTDIRIGGNTTADRKVIAGGGGGKGEDFDYAGGRGGDGGLVPTDGAVGFGPFGGAGGAALGGGAGTGANGSGAGGAGATGGGAGSAGGFDGDGARSGDGGGAGGLSSSTGTNTTYDTGYRSGDGWASITYTVTTQLQSTVGIDGWTHSQIAADVLATGAAGRLFAALGNLARNVLPGADPLLSANYTPSNGEVVTEESDPVRSMKEYTSALVVGTAQTARTLDPNRGYYPVALIHESRMSASEFDGRSSLVNGPIYLHATTRGVSLIMPNRAPISVGPETLEHNESPYVGPEWGDPDMMGDVMIWPAYFPATGDSVIFFAKIDFTGDTGFGRSVSDVVWHDAIYVQGRSVRCVYYWGGSKTRKPRLFFGAGTTTNPQQVGWVDLGTGGPEPFSSDGRPALTSSIQSPQDDLLVPGVSKVLERVEIPNLRHASEDNYLEAWGRADDGDWVQLTTEQDNDEATRVTAPGFVRLFAPVDTPIMGVELSVKFAFSQDDAATVDDWLIIHGAPLEYYTEVPDTIDVIETTVDARSLEWVEAQQQADALVALMADRHVRCVGADGKVRYVRVVGAMVKQHEMNDGAGAAAGTNLTRLGIDLTLRQVLV